MKKLARNSLALGTATLIVTAGLSFSANGADATKSYSTGRFLSGSIGGTNLDSLAQLKGVTAANPGNPGANTNPLSLTVLSTLPINIPGGLNLDLAKFLSASGAAGAVNQYAGAGSAGKATGASGLVNDSGAVLAPSSTTPPADAKVSLKNGPLSGINDNLVSVDLGLGALSSTTTVDKGAVSRGYRLAGLNLQLGVPLIGSLVSDLTTALAPVTAANSLSISPGDLCTISSTALTVTTTTLTSQLNVLVPGLGDTVGSLLTGLGLSNINLCDRTNVLLAPVFALLDNDLIADLIKIEVTGLGDLTTGIANFSSGGIDVNLTDGKITLDLGQILQTAGADLNQLPANKNILDYVTSDLVSEKITKVLNKVVTDLVANLGKVDIKISVAGTALPLKLTDVTGPVTKVLTDALTAATPLVQQIGQPIDQLLAQLVPNLNALVELTGNNQSTSKTPTLSAGTVKAGNVGIAAVGDYFRTSALKINVLKSTLNIDIAASEAAVLAADSVDGAAAAAAAGDDNSDAPADNGDGSDANADAAADAASDADADADANADTVADADAQADADVTTTLPSTGAPNLLPFWLLGIALLLFGGAVLVNERRRLSAI